MLHGNKLYSSPGPTQARLDPNNTTYNAESGYARHDRIGIGSGRSLDLICNARRAYEHCRRVGIGSEMRSEEYSVKNDTLHMQSSQEHRSATFKVEIEITQFERTRPNLKAI
jgi:hypothetical protein